MKKILIFPILFILSLHLTSCHVNFDTRTSETSYEILDYQEVLHTSENRGKNQISKADFFPTLKLGQFASGLIQSQLLYLLNLRNTVVNNQASFNYLIYSGASPPRNS